MAARRGSTLLEAEKELTRRSDELARAAAGAAVGAHRQGYRFDTDDGQRLARGPVPRPLAAARLSLHVRARLQGGLPVLLGDRRRVQRHRRASRQPRRHADGRVARAAREAAGLQAAAWAGPSRGPRRADSDFNADFNVSFTEEQQRTAPRIQLSSAAATRRMRPRRRPEPVVAMRAATAAPMRPPTRATARA